MKTSDFAIEAMASVWFYFKTFNDSLLFCYIYNDKKIKGQGQINPYPPPKKNDGRSIPGFNIPKVFQKRSKSKCPLYRVSKI